MPARCGDGVRRTDLQEGQEGYEPCDDGNEVQTDGCLTNCILPTCGDGHRRTDVPVGQEGFEACDDGNEVQTDACTNDCGDRAAVTVIVAPT